MVARNGCARREAELSGGRADLRLRGRRRPRRRTGPTEEAGATVLTRDQVMRRGRNAARDPGGGDLPRRHQAGDRARTDPGGRGRRWRRDHGRRRRHRVERRPRDRDRQRPNTGDRPIQVGSHYHFFETNGALDFDRDRTRGFRLDIPAGTAVRFEPGQSREVTLVKYAGNGRIFGFNGRVNGPVGG